MGKKQLENIEKRGAGRPAGVPNKSTTLAREAIAKFVDGNAHKLAEWLDRIAVDDPKGAFNSYMSVVEYHIPRLARTEMQPLDANGEKSDGFVITVNHVKPDAKTD